MSNPNEHQIPELFESRELIVTSMEVRTAMPTGGGSSRKSPCSTRVLQSAASLHFADADCFVVVSGLPASKSGVSLVVKWNQRCLMAGARKRSSIPPGCWIGAPLAPEPLEPSFLNRGRKVGRDAATIPTPGSIMDQSAVVLDGLRVSAKTIKGRRLYSELGTYMTDWKK